MPFPKAIKIQIENRLKEEGRWGEFRDFRTILHQRGVKVEDSWRVAAMWFRPLDPNKPNELLKDQRYSEIAANIDRGLYPEPPRLPKMVSGITDFDAKPELTPEQDEMIEEILEAPKKFKNKFEKAASTLDPTVFAPELDQVRWAMNHCYTDVGKIDPETIPCAGALKILELLQSNGRDMLEVLKLYLQRAMPTKDSQNANAFEDDGRLLSGLAEFERSLEGEEAAIESMETEATHDASG